MRKRLVLAGGAIGMTLLFLGVVFLGESVRENPVRPGFGGLFAAPPARDRSGFLPGLAMTIIGSLLVGFSAGASRSTPPRDMVYPSS